MYLFSTCYMLEFVETIWENKMWSLPLRGSQSRDKDIHLNGKQYHEVNNRITATAQRFHVYILCLCS